MEIGGTVKGISAAEEMIDIARKNNSVIGTSFSTSKNYYIYHWLLTSGEYVWNQETNEFVPNNGKYSREEILEQNKSLELAEEDLALWKHPSSLGLSMNTLENIFSKPDVTFKTQETDNEVNITFDRSIDGDDADYVYVEFENMDQNVIRTLYNGNGEVQQEASWIGKFLMKKNYNPGMTVVVSWVDENMQEHRMDCSMVEGKLLIPLGAGVRWLLNKHEYIQIYVLQDGQRVECPHIQKIQFLKLREAGKVQ